MYGFILSICILENCEEIDLNVKSSGSANGSNCTGNFSGEKI
jgi:hypothetical protein